MNRILKKSYLVLTRNNFKIKRKYIKIQFDLTIIIIIIFAKSTLLDDFCIILESSTKLGHRDGR